MVLERKFDLNGNFFPVAQCPALKNFYQQVAPADDQQLSLRRLPMRAGRTFGRRTYFEAAAQGVLGLTDRGGASTDAR